MAEQITVSLPDETKKALDEYSRRVGVSLEDLFRRFLESTVFSQRFYDLRETLVPKAERQGVRTGEDVFEQVS